MATIAGQPSEFLAAADQLRGATLRSELRSREIPAPERIAPYSIALAAGVARRSDDDDLGDDSVLDSAYGAGRIVLMYDPESAEEWGGPLPDRVFCSSAARG